jgi:YcxB-like protein
MISGIVTYSDYLAASRLHRCRTAIAINWITIFLAIIGIVLLFEGYRKWGINLLGAGIGGFVGEFVQTHVLLPRKVKHLYAQYKGITTPIIYEWDADLLRGQSSTGRGERSWKDFAKVREDDNVLLLYITDELYEVVPKSWFNEAAKLEDFRGYAKAGRTT